MSLTVASNHMWEVLVIILPSAESAVPTLSPILSTSTLSLYLEMVLLYFSHFLPAPSEVLKLVTKLLWTMDLQEYKESPQVKSVQMK